MSRQSLTDKAYNHIKSWIIGFRLKPGSHLSIQDLAEALGISRTPLREALKVLASEGLVVLQANRGARVSKVTREELQNTFPVIAVLEQLAATQEKNSAHLEDLREQLKGCVAKLNDKERELIEYRYCEDGRINDLAEKTGMKANSISKTLQRIRRKLYVCVNNAQGGLPA